MNLINSENKKYNETLLQYWYIQILNFIDLKKCTLPYYFSIVIDLYKNMFDVKKSKLYLNGFTYKNVIRFYIMHGVLIIAFVFLFIFFFSKLEGSISNNILLIKQATVFLIYALIATAMVFVIKQKVFFKEFFLGYLISFSISIPIFAFFYLPIFLNFQAVNIDFFIGGGNSEFPRLKWESIYFYYYFIYGNIIVIIFTGTIIPIIVLRKLININLIVLFLITQFTAHVSTNLLRYLNPKIFDFTIFLDKVLSILNI